MKFFLLLFLLYTNIFSNTNIQKSWLEKQPRSITKDFYLSLYLKQNISSDDAIWALGEAKRVNNKLLYPYAKALKHKETSEVIKCKQMTIIDILSQDAHCISLGLNLSKTRNLNKTQLEILKSKLKVPYVNLYNIIRVLNSKDPFTDILKLNSQTFLKVFMKGGKEFRKKYLNEYLPMSTLNKLKANQNKYYFYAFVKYIVTSNDLNKLKESLLNLDAKDMEHRTQFLLAINAIRYSKNKLALNFLNEAMKTAYYNIDKDKVLYWQYQLNNDKKVLEKLSLSLSNNIYSIFAKEQLNIEITNLKYDDIIKNDAKSTYNVKDPFKWLKVLDDIKDKNISKEAKYKKLFNTKELQGHLALIQERIHKYKDTYLPNPYKNLIKNYSPQRQALINSIAKQESRFIPTSISTSYAMGVMQIMPFLSKDIAINQLKEPYNILKQLEAATNIRYSNHHLDFLQKRLNHVLFIAYAYNGGIGFTKRKILQAGLFKNKKYEPYLSMELIPYDESKKYGKRVLVNYLLYNNYLNKDNPLKLSDLINSIKNPY